MADQGLQARRERGKYTRSPKDRAAIGDRNRVNKRKYPVGFDTKSRLYRIWRAMYFRCHQPSHPAYARYHGRGIAVCDEWRTDYPAFMAWALAHGYNDRLTIDRRDNDLGYFPENCHWINSRQQNLNKRNSLAPLTIFGDTKLPADWALDPRCVVRANVFYSRLNIGWDPGEALITPKGAPKEPVYLTAFGETKRPPQWADDPRCAADLSTIYYRLKRGWTGERVLSPLTRRYVSADGRLCPEGHDLAGDNLYIEPSGRRRCRICMRAIEARRPKRTKRRA